MSAGSSSNVVTVSYTRKNFSGTTSHTASYTNTDSWNFPSPRIKPRGTLTPTPGSLSKLEYNTAGIDRTLGSGLSKTEYIGAPPLVALSTYFVQTVQTYSSDQLANEALASARAKFSVGDVNFGVFIGELKSSAKMVAERSLKLSKYIEDFQNLNWKALGTKDQVDKAFSEKRKKEIKALPKSKRFANAYLELMFGWLPLLKDLWAATDAFNNSLRDKGTRVSRSSRRSNGKVVARAGVTGSVSNPFLRSLAELGLLNPGSVLWELMPFSFLVDYIATIGDSIAGLTAGIGMKDVFQWQVVETITETYRSGTSGSYAYPATLVSTRTVVNRTVTPLTLLGPMSSKELNLTVRRASTTIALIVQRIR